MLQWSIDLLLENWNWKQLETSKSKEDIRFQLIVLQNRVEF